VTFEEGYAMRTEKVQFLVMDCKSLYNCIIGRPTMVELVVVFLVVHLKVKYHTKDYVVGTLHGNIEVARNFFLTTNKTRAMSSCLKPFQRI
jgi:hypothetical protein